MPELSVIKRAQDIGYTSPNSSKMMWSACVNCGKERWVLLRKDEPMFLTCRKCAAEIRGTKQWGANNPSWRGGRHIGKGGYVQIRLLPDDFFYGMASQRCYVAEHRLVMAQHLGRCLHLWEIVHHKHTKYPAGSIEDKQDNRIENLQLVTDDRHKQITVLEQRISWLEKRVTLLEAENIVQTQNINK